MRYFFTSCLILFGSLLHAEGDLDSILSAIEDEKDPVKKIRLHHQAADAYHDPSSSAACIDQLTQALFLAESVSHDTLIAQNLDLAKRVEIGGALRVSSVNATAMRLRSNGKYTETNKAQKATAVRVGFRVEKNEIAEVGEKLAHVVINTPSGKIINQKGTFNQASDGSEVGYTDEIAIDYQGAAKDGVIFVENISYKFEKGLYPIKVYVDGVLVGATTMELKDAFLGL